VHFTGVRTSRLFGDAPQHAPGGTISRSKIGNRPDKWRTECLIDRGEAFSYQHADLTDNLNAVSAIDGTFFALIAVVGISFTNSN
jgi:hypothetical protein